MRKLTFLISILCVTLFFNSCKNSKKSDCERYGLNTNVKSVSVKSYYAESKFGEIVKGDLDIIGHYLVLFDDKGYLTSISDFIKGEKLIQKIVFAYDDENRLIKETFYNKDGDVSHLEEWVYEGKYLMQEKYISDKYVGVREYKRDGEKIYEYTDYDNGERLLIAKFLESSSRRAIYVIYDSLGNELEMVNKEYNEDGRLLKKIVNGESKADTTIWAYNNSGELIKMTTSNYSGEINYNENNLPTYIKGGMVGTSMVDRYKEEPFFLDSFKDDEYYIEYEYDDKGNWIKKILYEGDMKKPYRIVERVIVY